MRVCFIGDSNSIFVMRIADWLKDNGCLVQMIGLAETRKENASHYDQVADVIRQPGFGGYLGRLFPIRKLVAQMNPDITHGHYLTSGGWYAVWSGHRPVINTVWGSDLYQDPKKKSLRWLVRSAIRGSDAITGDSNHIIAEVKKYSPNVRTEKILMGVDTNVFKPMPELKDEVFTFLSGRSSYPIYNPIRIVKAFELLPDDGSRLLLQRSRNPYPELDKVVDASPVKNRIEWYPVRDHSEMPMLFNRAHVTISVPNSDSSSGVMMESMACGIPVIASPIPQNDEWDELGIWIPKSDSVEALAELMKKVKEQPHIVEAYGRFARDTIIQRADWNGQMEKLLRLYEDLI